MSNEEGEKVIQRVNPKHFVFVTIGTRGDVEPFVALAQGLKTRITDANVVIVSHDEFQGFIEDNGIRFASIGASPMTSRLESAAGQALDKATVFQKLKKAQEFMEPLIKTWSEGAYKTLQTEKSSNSFSSLNESPIVILSTLALFIVPAVCEKLDLTFMGAHLMPQYPTRAHGPPSGGSNGNDWFPSLKWNMADQMGYSMIYKKPVESFRSAIDLPPLPKTNKSGYTEIIYKKKIPIIMGYSPSLVERPVDWPDQVMICGYWQLKGACAYTPPNDLAAFLGSNSNEEGSGNSNSGSTHEKASLPVYIGLGSMLKIIFSSEDKRRNLLDAFVNAARLTERRVIISTAGCESVPELPADIASDKVFLLREAVPHTWLFPKCSVVVCHGGAGTVHNALSAACPIVTVPCLPLESEQCFWAGMIYRAGISPIESIPVASIKRGQHLGRTIKKAVNTIELFEKARKLSVAMSHEDGVETACAFISKTMTH